MFFFDSQHRHQLVRVLVDVFLALKMTCLEGYLAFQVVWFAPCELFAYHSQNLFVGLVGEQRSLVLSLDESLQQNLFGWLEIDARSCGIDDVHIVEKARRASTQRDDHILIFRHFDERTTFDVTKAMSFCSR